MNVDYNPFEGISVKGVPVSVLSRGEFVIRDRHFVGRKGAGRYLKRTPYIETDIAARAAKSQVKH
jgi:dihydropyrimidinase